jgi:hypothetical protein
MTCEVCGHRLGPRFWRLDDGRVWCGRHVDEPTCRYCGFPVAAHDFARCCARCGSSAVSTSADIVEHRVALRCHMDRIGLVLPAPTQVLLAHPGLGLGPVHAGRSGLGRTYWRTSRGRLLAPITIQVAGGLPGHVFRRTLAHEFGHAAIAGGRRTDAQSLEVLEGFAECVSLEHLVATGAPQAQRQVEQMLTNADPVYGDGLRLVRPWVERHGLVEVAAAIRAGSVSRLARRTA